MRQAAATPDWVRAFNRRRSRAYLLASAGSFVLLLRVRALAPSLGYWGAAGVSAVLLVVVTVGLFAYGRWTASARYCKELPAARQLSTGASFHRCLLIDRPSGKRWVDRGGVLVLDDARARLCEARADLRISSEVAWGEIDDVIVARSRVRLGRFVELATRGGPHRLYCTMAAVRDIKGRLHARAIEESN